jgi:hypothetical protein
VVDCWLIFWWVFVGFAVDCWLISIFFFFFFVVLKKKCIVQLVVGCRGGFGWL